MATPPPRLEAGALTVGLWLLATATALAVQTSGYLPAVGAAPLRFQPPAAAGRPGGWGPLPLPEERETNVTAVATNAAAVPAATETTNHFVLAPPPTVAPPTSAPPPGPPPLSLPPPVEAVSPARSVVDMSAILNWLSPGATTAPAGSLLFPAFVPATPPRSSTAVYEVR